MEQVDELEEGMAIGMAVTENHHIPRVRPHESSRQTTSIFSHLIRHFLCSTGLDALSHLWRAVGADGGGCVLGVGEGEIAHQE